MKSHFEVLSAKHLDWMTNVRNQNREWFMNSQPVEFKDTETWFEKSTDNGDLNLVIKTFGGDRVGFISVYNISPDGSATIGRMMVHDKFKHQGYMEGAMIGVLDICKRYLGIESLTLEVKKNNIPARDLYCKFGFVTFGITRDTLIMRKLV